MKKFTCGLLIFLLLSSCASDSSLFSSTVIDRAAHLPQDEYYNDDYLSRPRIDYDQIRREKVAALNTIGNAQIIRLNDSYWENDPIFPGDDKLYQDRAFLILKIESNSIFDNSKFELGVYAFGNKQRSSYIYTGNSKYVYLSLKPGTYAIEYFMYSGSYKSWGKRRGKYLKICFRPGFLFHVYRGNIFNIGKMIVTVDNKRKFYFQMANGTLDSMGLSENDKHSHRQILTQLSGINSRVPVFYSPPNNFGFVSRKKSESCEASGLLQTMKPDNFYDPADDAVWDLIYENMPNGQ